jgi:hypothetical protein
MDFYMVLQELLIEDARIESEDEPYAQDPSGESNDAFSPINLNLFSEDQEDDDEADHEEDAEDSKNPIDPPEDTAPEDQAQDEDEPG